MGEDIAYSLTAENSIVGKTYNNSCELIIIPRKTS